MDRQFETHTVDPFLIWGDLNSMQNFYDKSRNSATQYAIKPQTNTNECFSLVELLIVTGIIGLMLWVMVPIGLRSRLDASYGVVRQNCTELASYTSQWVQQSIMAQDEQQSSATAADYYGSLAGLSHAPPSGPAPGEWLAGIGPSNWRQNRDGKNPTQTRVIIGRFMNGKDSTAPENCVENLIPKDRPILNPFNKISIFDPENFPSPISDGGKGPVPGSIAFGGFHEEKEGWVYFAFVFQGISSIGTLLDGPDTFLPGMNLQTMEGLQNGIFAARIR
jgi:competence protein ComGC